MSEASDTTAPHSEENLTADNFYEILKGLDAKKNDSIKLKIEHESWFALLLDSADETVEHLSSLNITRKAIQTLTFARCKVHFEFSTTHAIVNMSDSSKDQCKHMTYMENCECNFPLSSNEKRYGLHSKINNNKSMNNNND